MFLIWSATQIVCCSRDTNWFCTCCKTEFKFYRHQQDKTRKLTPASVKQNLLVSEVNLRNLTCAPGCLPVWMPSSVSSGNFVLADFENFYMPGVSAVWIPVGTGRSLSSAVSLLDASEAKKEKQSHRLAFIFLPWIFHCLPRTAGLGSYSYLSAWLPEICSRAFKEKSSVCHYCLCSVLPWSNAEPRYLLVFATCSGCPHLDGKEDRR